MTQKKIESSHGWLQGDLKCRQRGVGLMGGLDCVVNLGLMSYKLFVCQIKDPAASRND